VPLAAAEMALLKIAIAGEMPPPELAAEILKEIKSGNFKAPVISPAKRDSGGDIKASTERVLENGGGPAAMTVPQPVPVSAPTLQINSLAEFTDHLPDSQIQLKYDVERYVRVVRFKPGAITIAKMDRAPVTLVGRMVEALRDMTGELWLIDQVDDAGAPSISEARKTAKSEQDARDRSHPAFSHSLLKKAKLLEIRNTATKSDSNVIAADFGAPNPQDET